MTFVEEQQFEHLSFNKKLLSGELWRMVNECYCNNSKISFWQPSVGFFSGLGTKMAGVYDLAFRQIRDFPRQCFYILIHTMSCHGKKKWSVAENLDCSKGKTCLPVWDFLILWPLFPFFNYFCLDIPVLILLTTPCYCLLID